MTSFGYSLMCELHHPNDLLDQARKAEEAGFDFLTISDHIHPWLYSHHHSPFAWSVLGALAAQTERVELVSLVTCPTIRYHPVIVAQAAQLHDPGEWAVAHDPGARYFFQERRGVACARLQLRCRSDHGRARDWLTSDKDGWNFGGCSGWRCIRGLSPGRKRWNREGQRRQCDFLVVGKIGFH